MTEPGGRTSLQGEYAGVASRGAALLIDTAILAIVFAFSDLLVDLGLDLFTLESSTSIRTGWIWTALWWAYGISIAGVYYGFFWSTLGQTPGKLIMGLRVIRLDGSLLSPGRAILRYVGYWPSSILLLGFALALFSSRRQTLHDKLVGSVVVYAWNAKPAEGIRWASRLRDVQSKHVGSASDAKGSDNSR